MNHRLKKLIIIIILTIIVVFGTSGCGSRYYRGDYPELFTVALNSLLGTRGVTNNEIDDPRIIVLEEDDHGRTLFMYGEGRGLGISILISQKSDDNDVYFYPHYNFIIFESFAEMTSRATSDGLRMDHFYPEIIAQIDELKERNDWNQELDLEKSVRKKIDVNNHPAGPISRNRLKEAFGIAWSNGEERNPHDGTFVFLTADEYGRSVYLGFRRKSEEESGIRDWRQRPVRNIVMLFQPDGYFDEVNGFLELEDMLNYQTILREFKERGGWNQPFEGSTGISLWWIITGVVIVGTGGFVAILLYLRRKGEGGSKFSLTALRSRAIYALRGRVREFLSLYPLGRGRRKVFSLLYIILPSVLVNGAFFLPIIFLRILVTPSIPLHVLMMPAWYSIVFLYLVTAIAVALFFKYKPCEFNVLKLGFLLSPMVLFVYAMVIFISAFPFSILAFHVLVFMMTAPTLLYALPFIGISFLLKSRLQK